MIMHKTSTLEINVESWCWKSNIKLISTDRFTKWAKTQKPETRPQFNKKVDDRPGRILCFYKNKNKNIKLM